VGPLKFVRLLHILFTIMIFSKTETSTIKQGLSLIFDLALTEGTTHPLSSHLFTQLQSVKFHCTTRKLARKHINTDSDQAHWGCVNTLNLYLGGAQFKSQP